MRRAFSPVRMRRSVDSSSDEHHRVRRSADLPFNPIRMRKSDGFSFSPVRMRKADKTLPLYRKILFMIYIFPYLTPIYVKLLDVWKYIN